MGPNTLFLIIFLIGEAVAFLIFKVMVRILGGGWKWAFDCSVVKGILERFFLFISLILGLPQGLIAFGALKVGSRFTEEAEKITSDYFFIGNITSITLAVLYFFIWNQLI